MTYIYIYVCVFSTSKKMYFKAKVIHFFLFLLLLWVLCCFFFRLVPSVLGISGKLMLPDSCIPTSHSGEGAVQLGSTPDLLAHRAQCLTPLPTTLCHLLALTGYESGCF